MLCLRGELVLRHRRQNQRPGQPVGVGVAVHGGDAIARHTGAAGRHVRLDPFCGLEEDHANSAGNGHRSGKAVGINPVRVK